MTVCSLLRAALQLTEFACINDTMLFFYTVQSALTQYCIKRNEKVTELVLLGA